MNNWIDTKLKYCIKINNGREIKRQLLDGIPVYGSGGVFKYTDEYLYEGEALLFGRKGSIGKPLFISGKFWTVDTMFYATVKNDDIIKYFYYYFLIFPWTKLQTNTTIPSIVGTDVGNENIKIPNKAIQKTIVTYLDFKTSAIDNLISLKENQIQILEEQRQAMITEAITKGLDSSVEMKESGIEWIGEIPVNWEVKKIKFLSDIKRGASPRPIDDPKYYSENGEYSWVRIADVTRSGKYLVETRDRLSSLGASKSVKRHKGDLFLSIAGTVGKACITQINCCIHDGFVYFDNLKIKEELLYYIFESGQCYKGLGKFGTQLNLNTDTVGNISIPVCNQNESEEILVYLQKKDLEYSELIKQVELQLAKIDEYRQSLIHETVTGKTSVEEMENYLKEVE